MAEVNIKDYANRYADTNKKRTTRVVHGALRKRSKGLSEKLVDIFLEEDINNVKDYIFENVLKPTIKDAIANMTIGAIEMLFYGRTTKGSKTASANSTTRISYNSIYSAGNKDNESRRAGVNRDYQNIVLPSKADAEAVLTVLCELISKYNAASVGDLYDALGMPSDFTDQKYGWESLATARCRYTRDGYVLDLPRPTVINQ